MTKRLLRGIEPKEDFPARPIFEELIRDKHLLIAKHTRRHLRSEINVPGAVIDRANHSRWLEEGGLTLGERARREVARLVKEYEPSTLGEAVKRELRGLMQSEASRAGLNQLPEAIA
jgi:trimethylamine:corrinoid methyltransferase-like protein